MRYALFSAAVVALVAFGEVRGVAVGSGVLRHPPVPASVRTSPGGYRSYHFWHSGLHGGK